MLLVVILEACSNCFGGNSLNHLCRDSRQLLKYSSFSWRSLFFSRFTNIFHFTELHEPIVRQVSTDRQRLCAAKHPILINPRGSACDDATSNLLIWALLLHKRLTIME